MDRSGGCCADEPAPPNPRQHWAFQRPDRPDLPSAGQAAGFTNPIDALLAGTGEQNGLTPNASADKGVLLRRLYLDLIGLPPTRTELHAFVADQSPDAYERVVEQLLARPQYGERWARHWMDVWRYADWAGFAKEVRDSQPHIWHWRDWIVESLNTDRGYDRMITDMLAGDELVPDDPQTLRATGYLARNWYRFNRNVWLDNTVEHMGKAFLGITLNCARCHDHRYDPIPQRDYYRMRAFFEPYEVRVDRLANEPSIEADGIARLRRPPRPQNVSLRARAGYAAQRRRAARSGRAGSIRGQPDQDSDCVPAGSVVQPRLEIVCPRRTARAIARGDREGNHGTDRSASQAGRGA